MMIRECLSHLVVILKQVRPQQPLRLWVGREAREEVNEVLVFSFGPHII